jgi:hypothetical protein
LVKATTLALEETGSGFESIRMKECSSKQEDKQAGGQAFEGQELSYIAC